MQILPIRRCVILGFLLQLAFPLSPPAAAAEPLLLPARCTSQVLQEAFFPPHPLTEKLNDVTMLKNRINALLADPEIPKDLKRVVLKALDQDLGVVQLTRTVKSERNIYKPGVYSIHNDKNYVVFRTEGVQNGNDIATAKMKTGGLPHKHTVFVNQRLPTRNEDALVTLVHELSHVKMAVFLEEYLPQLAKRFPPDLIRLTDDGRYGIHSELYSFIMERYALETEYRLLKAGYGKHLDWVRPDRYGDKPGLFTDAEMSQRITDYVIQVYKITDPQVLELRNHTLHDALTKGLPFLRPLDF